MITYFFLKCLKNNLAIGCKRLANSFTSYQKIYFIKDFYTLLSHVKGKDKIPSNYVKKIGIFAI